MGLSENDDMSTRGGSTRSAVWQIHSGAGARPDRPIAGQRAGAGWHNRLLQPTARYETLGLVMDGLQAIDRRRDALVARLQLQGEELRVMA